ncbi:MAG: hypothetical protein ACI8UO_005073 [Verrucomicrobiales bacterium]|jgi:hypothetical protein
MTAEEKIQLESAFGALTDAEAEELNAEMAERGESVENQLAVQQLLADVAAKAPVKQNAPAPAMPESARRRMEDARAEAFARASAAEESVEALPPSTEHGQTFFGWLATALFSGPGLAVAGGVAAIAVTAFILISRGGLGAGDPLVASSADVQTPGVVTGFTEPTLTWKTDKAAPVRVVIEDVTSGAIVASVEQAFSPLPFEKLGVSGLAPGKAYRVRIESGKETLAVSPFSVADSAAGAPERDATLNGVVKQCETLIAASRHADAWMLWAALTEAEQADPRMQKLKALILDAIGQA